MTWRKSLQFRPLTMFLAAILLVVAIACGGEAATPTSPPTATSKPTATSAPTATAVPESTPMPDEVNDWVGYLMSHPGYKPEWGTPQYGGTYRTADPRAVTRFQLTMGYSAYSRWQFAQFNSLLMFDPWLELDQPARCDLCESFEVSADGLHITFKLRQGVQFQSEGWGQDKGAPASSYGAEMTCEDVKTSMEWFANPPEAIYPSSRRAMQTYMGNLKDVTCPDGPNGYTAVDQERRKVVARELNLYMVNERTTAPGMGVMNVAWPNKRYVKGVYYYNLGTYSQQRLHDRIWLAQ